MNLDEIKKMLKMHVNSKVEVNIYGSRNKNEICIGTISNVYPNIFTILVDGENKSFRYGDIITGDVKLKFL